MTQIAENRTAEAAHALSNGCYRVMAPPKYLTPAVVDAAEADRIAGDLNAALVRLAGITGGPALEAAMDSDREARKAAIRARKAAIAVGSPAVDALKAEAEQLAPTSDTTRRRQCEHHPTRLELALPRRRGTNGAHPQGEDRLPARVDGDSVSTRHPTYAFHCFSVLEDEHERLEGRLMARQAPKGLGRGGNALWRRIVPLYDLRPDEYETLEDVCRITDVIDALDADWAKNGRPMTAKGSMGQLIIHPVVGEMRVQRLARNVLWRQLKLPDLDGKEQPNPHRAAIQARWASPRGTVR